MPSWKKVVVSGSDASLASIYTSSHITGSANISSSLASTGSFGSVQATTFHGDGTGLTGVTADTANISVKEEGSSLTSQVSSINFVGSVVTATNIGNDITVSITSGTSLASAFDQDENDDLMPTAGGEIIPVFYELDSNSDLMPRETN